MNGWTWRGVWWRGWSRIFDDVKVFDGVLHHVARWRGWVDLQVLNGVDAGERKARMLVIQKVAAARKKSTVVSAPAHIQLSSRHRGEHAHTQGGRRRARRDEGHLELARAHQSTQVPVIASVYKTTISQCSVLRHADWQSFRAPARLQMPVSKSSSQPIPTLELPLQTLLASSRGGGGSQ